MFQRVLKRVFDQLVAFFGLLFFSWILLLAFLIASIDLQTNGIFVQERIGKNGKVFKIFKIRTMKPGTEGGLTTTKNDNRVSAIGALFRKLKIDELPQIINVLNGSMSFVGPRPTVREDFDKMSEMQQQRFNVRPGITGLAQVNGNTELSWPARIEYDLEYVRNWTFWLDIKILAKTFALIFTNKIETHPKTEDEWAG